MRASWLAAMCSLALVVVGCRGADELVSGDGGSDSGAGGDVDADTDADTDTDTGTDGDTDTDTDADTDGDTDTDTDADADADTDVDGDTDSDSDNDGDSDTDSDTDGDGDTDSDSDNDSDTDSETETETGGCGDTGTGTDGDTDTDTDSDGDTDTALDAGPDAGDVDLDAGDDASVDGGGDGGAGFPCGQPLLDDRDERSYPTVLIGEQCWMAANLDVGTMIISTTAQSDNEIVEKYCYGDDAGTCADDGALYQWNELMDYGSSDGANPSTTRGICPAGWHLPSDAEVKTLEIALGMTPTEADMTNTWRGEGAGTAIGPGGSSGFEAQMSGRFYGSGFHLVDLYGYIYTSTASGTSYAWRRCFAPGSSTIGRYDTFPKSYGFSARCVLD